MTFDPIDFASAEAFDTEHPSLTITGASGEAITFAQWYRGTNGSRNSLYYGSASVTLPTSYAAIPAARQRPTDLHEGWAFSSVTQPSGVVRGRTVTAYWHDAGSRVIALPAVPSSDPSVTVVSSSPFAKLRAQVAVPAGASPSGGFDRGVDRDAPLGDRSESDLRGRLGTCGDVDGLTGLGDIHPCVARCQHCPDAVHRFVEIVDDGHL